MASTGEELIKNADIKKIAKKGTRIYEKIKDNYDSSDNGKYLAIEVDSEEVFLGDTSAEALILAKQTYQNKVFYVIKIGYDVAEFMAKSYVYAD